MRKNSEVPFTGTKEQEVKLYEAINAYKGKDGALMPVLQAAQGIYGYLPIEVQKIVSKELNVSLEHIYGVITFYSQFNLSPKGKNQVSVCLGTACYVKGSGNLLDKLKEILKINVSECTPNGEFSLEATRCIGACGLAPVMTVNDDVYGRLTVADLAGIVSKYKV